MKSMKSHWLVRLGKVALIVVLVFIGSFFIYWGGWGYVYGSKYDLFFGPVFGLFGGSVIFGAVTIVVAMIDPSRSKWLVALGVSSLYLGSFFLYFGLKDFFFPRFPADIEFNAPLGIRFGCVTILAGIVFLLADLVFQKRK